MVSLKPSSLALDELNIVVNNSKDLDFFVAATQHPSNLKIMANDKFYEGRGHCFTMAYAAFVSTLCAFDPEFGSLPDPTNWEQAISRCKHSGKIEYYHGSPVRVPPIGLHALFEGQARFSQMQYLYLASGKTCNWDEFEAAGMFEGIYIEAFCLFLLLTGIPKPDNVLSPPVGLFLLICDIAINPIHGFPLPIRCFDTFIDDVDPGTRFLRLCQAVKDDSVLLTAIRSYTQQEYTEVSSTLCHSTGIIHPNAGLAIINKWKIHNPIIGQIAREGESMKFEGGNMLLRLMMARFMVFCEDKCLYPEFFCWLGARMAEPNAHDRAIHLFQSHQSLYTNRVDKRGIFPRTMSGIDPKQCVDTLNEFYSWNVLYDMTRQWVLEEGVFDLSFDWLTDADNEEVFQWANSIFSGIYGIKPEHFEIL